MYVLSHAGQAAASQNTFLLNATGSQHYIQPRMKISAEVYNEQSSSDSQFPKGQ